MPELSNLTPVNNSYFMFARLEIITQMARSCWSVAVQTCRQPDSCCDVFSPSEGETLYYFMWRDTKNWSSKTTICFAARNGSPVPGARGMQHTAGEAAALSRTGCLHLQSSQSAPALKYLPRQPWTALVSLLSYEQTHATVHCNKSVSAGAIKN